MSDIESEGEIFYKAQQASIIDGRIKSVAARIEDLEYDVFGNFRKPINGNRETLVARVADLEGRLGKQEPAAFNDPNGPDLFGGGTREEVEEHRKKPVLERITALERDVYGFEGAPRGTLGRFHWKLETRVTGCENLISGLQGRVWPMENLVEELQRRIESLEAKLADDGK